MTDDLDVEELLEAPFKKGEDYKLKENGVEDKGNRSNKKKRKHSRSRSRDRDKKDKDKERGKERRRSRDKDRKRSKSRERKRSRERRSKSRDRKRKSGEKHERRRSPSPIRRGRRRTPSPIRDTLETLTPEERDARTVFCMQLSQRVRVRDLEDFFTAVGKIRDVKLITDTKTGRSKGIAYVEFAEISSVPLALGLSGQKLMGVPIICQPTHAEKNRIAAASSSSMAKGITGPMRLYVGSLHFNITEEMLRGIFEPFGKIDNIQLIMDPETGRSKGYGFITFHDAEDAKKALEQLNGFELAGRPMKVGHVTERSDTATGPSILDNDELERTGIDLGATGRLQLMAKLAEGTGMEIPAAAATALQMAPVIPQQQVVPPIATQCFMLSNMFEPAKETNPFWADEIKDDVIEECNRHGGCVHAYIDKASPQGNVYVKCPSISAAVHAVNALHGRWFAGKVITAAYVPVLNYHNLFPDAMTATSLLFPRSRRD